jgi:hypothetical protein
MSKEAHMNLSPIFDPTFLSDETLRRIREIATEVLVSQADFDLAQKVTTVQSYGELIVGAPTNVEYHAALKRATKRMIEAMRQEKRNNGELADRLEEILD